MILAPHLLVVFLVKHLVLLSTVHGPEELLLHSNQVTIIALKCE